MAVSYLGGLTRARQVGGTSNQRLNAYPIQNSHQAAFYTGTPVKLSAGLLDVATNGAAVLGVGCGYRWIDKTTGQPQFKNFIPATTSNKNSGYNDGFTTPYALVDDNPNGTWTISTETSVSAGNLGALARVTNAGAGSAVTGRSSAELDLSGTAVSAGDAMFRIIGLKRISEITSAGGEDNDWNSTSTLVEVVFQNHLFN